jgi:hypothetical protein
MTGIAHVCRHVPGETCTFPNYCHKSGCLNQPKHVNDPCDDVSAWIWVQWTPVMMDSRTRHIAISDPFTYPTFSEPPPYHLGRFNCRGDYVMDQRDACHHGHHRWSEWGNYIPAPLPPFPVTHRDPGPPDIKPNKIEAYRWRYCECGIAERETYADHTVVRINREDD